MTWMYGQDFEYGNSRLAGTYAKHLGKIVFIENISPRGVATISCDGKVEDVNCLDIDTSPIKLGFFNGGGSVGYIQRIPVRRYRQGLCQENVNITSRVPLTFHRAMSFLGKDFPTFKVAINSLAKEAAQKSIAWSYDWAACKNGDIMYRGLTVVGTLVEGKVALDKSHSYLQESLEESL